MSFPKRAGLAAAVSAVFLTGIAAVAVARPPSDRARCTSNPVITKGESTRAVTVTCYLPREPSQTVTGPPVTITAPPITITAPPVTVTAPPVTVTATPTTSATSTPRPSVLDLPRVAWEGGPAYWKKFPKADAAGWDDPRFLPQAVWYGSCNSAQYAYDKSLGLNTYAQCNEATTYDGLRDAGMFSLFTAKGQPADATNQPGTLLDDEVDGRFDTAAGLQWIRGLRSQYDVSKTGRFTYANWTSGIVTYDRSTKFSTDYYNTVDVNSVDQYFHSVPHCDTLSLRWRTPATSSYSSGQPGTTIDRGNCRTPSSYGKMIDLQLDLNRARGVDGPIWALTEVISTGGSTNNYRQPSTDQVKGAAIAAIIHEARGLMWFSQSPDQSAVNNCGSGDAFRDARLGYGCAAIKANVAAVGQVNAQINALAPVINTQSYVWNFGPNTDTMLKAYDGSAYVFAMSKDGVRGNRTFTLPAGLTGDVEVLNENRKLATVNGTFTDSFGTESAYHIYRIAIS